MSHANDKIASLIGSRICHDIISPIGAIANGLELMELAGIPYSAEMDLVRESALNASARVRLFRLAFGEASADQSLDNTDLKEILSSVFNDGRVKVDWQVPGQNTREDVKAALLALMCVENALIAGGRIEVAKTDAYWAIRAAGPKIRLESDHWDILNGTGEPNTLTPAAVQFALLAEILRQKDLNIEVQYTENQILLRF